MHIAHCTLESLLYHHGTHKDKHMLNVQLRYSDVGAAITDPVKVGQEVVPISFASPQPEMDEWFIFGASSAAACRSITEDYFAKAGIIEPAFRRAFGVKQGCAVTKAVFPFTDDNLLMMQRLQAASMRDSLFAASPRDDSIQTQMWVAPSLIVLEKMMGCFKGGQVAVGSRGAMGFGPDHTWVLRVNGGHLSAVVRGC